VHKLVVHYPEPADRKAFQDYYEAIHLPLAAELPGIRKIQYSFDAAAVGGESRYFAVFEAEFDSAEGMGAALGSAQGAAVAADVSNYATGGAHISHYPVTKIGPDPRQIIVEYLDRWNAHDVAGIISMFAVGGCYTDPSLSNAELSGDHLAHFLERMFAAVPDLTLTVTTAAADTPDTAVAFWMMSGTATGPHPSTSGGTFNLRGADILHIDRAGRITWTAALYDQKTFLEQGGFAPLNP
jgi:uncharacterized protein (TIGR02118 family)/steroid delta-isomerase-like uncharacterized protein